MMTRLVEVLKGKWATFRSYLIARKKFVYVEETEMKRILTALDLTLLGIGSMLGMGVYITGGTLAKSVGPAMLISYILAGFVCILSAFCYAEFAGRAPGTGSAYAYCYITVGEFIAFLLGWNLVLEFVIGTACLARGLSGYIDSLANKVISEKLTEAMPMGIPFFSPYPDFFALLIMLVFSGIISFGVRESSIVNNIVVAINLTTITILVIIGFVYAKASNWAIDPDTVPKKFDGGEGGFVPFGIGKVLQGAAIAFYAYTGFDTVATTGAEAKNPSRAIPIALIGSLTTALVVYCGISSTFTLMWPYYDQDTDAPYPYILHGIGLPKMKWVVTVGAIAAITGSTLASIFGMARIVYSIAADGLLFRFLGKVNKKTKTPMNSCMLSGLLTGLISVIFDTDQLVNMTSLGTLMAYSMVAVCILILRYEPISPSTPQQIQRGTSPQPQRRYVSTLSVTSLLNVSGGRRASPETFDIALFCIVVFCIATFFLNLILAVFEAEILSMNLAAVIPAILLAVVIFVLFIILQRQPTQPAKLIIKVKPVPLVPLVTIFVNTQLMLRLEWETWVRFIIWIILGLVIYFSYGIRHSTERIQKQRTENM